MKMILCLSTLSMALLAAFVSPSYGQYGACCFDQGECLYLPEEDCYAAGGLYFLPDTPCEPNPCMPAACCFEDGSCDVMTEAYCLDSGGIVWIPEVDCDPNPCPQVGSCCYHDGVCVLLTYWDCVLTEGTYLWMEYADCDPNPCPNCFCIGCCLPGGSCQMVDPEICTEDGGEHFGNWVTCTPNPCYYPPGACCFETGQCVVLAQDHCWEGPGAYAWFGGLSCDPDPCPTSSVPETPANREATWGSIKVAYR